MSTFFHINLLDCRNQKYWQMFSVKQIIKPKCKVQTLFESSSLQNQTTIKYTFGKLEQF